MKTGTVYTETVVHAAPEQFVADAPYQLAIVTGDDGTRATVRIAGEADDLLNVIHKLDDKLERVMLFGHNPELTELAHRLSSGIASMPTCAVAEFTFAAESWSNIGKTKPARVALDYPRKS